MKVRSTGLGKTVLTAHFAGLEFVEESGSTLELRIETTEPVHWRITANLGGEDVRRAAALLLKPAILLRVITMFFRRH